MIEIWCAECGVLIEEDESLDVTIYENDYEQQICEECWQKYTRKGIGLAVKYGNDKKD